MRIANWADIGQMDELGRLDTPVHRVDARAKAAVTLAFVAVVVSFPRDAVSALTPLFLYPLSLVALGRIPMRPLLRKLLVAAPFAVAVGILNPWLDREPVVALGPLVVTRGWLSFVSILLRFALTAGAALALVACTGMHRLVAGLEQLGCPRVFAVQLLFLYRYLFVVADEGVKTMRAVELRSAGGRSPRLATYGSLVGHLLLRAMDRAERVYRAMTARGFDGEVRVLRRSRFGWGDAAFVLLWALFLAAARTWNLADGVGRLLTGARP